MEHQMNSNIIVLTLNELEPVYLLVVQLEHLFLASNEQTSNIEPNRDFTIFTKLLIEQTRTSVFENQMNSNMFSFLLIEL